jgi:hypothetical protein
MRHAIIFYRICQRRSYVGLSDQIAECLRAPLPGYNLIAHFASVDFALLLCLLSHKTKNTTPAQPKQNKTRTVPAKIIVAPSKLTLRSSLSTFNRRP